MDSFRVVTLLRRLHVRIRLQVTEDLRARGYDDITAAHLSVFQTPGPDGMRPTELARRTLMTKQAMNHLLAGLEARGYLERVASGGDGRARVLRLTRKGRQLTKIIQQRAAEIERRWGEELGPERTRELVAALEDLDAVGVAAENHAVT